MQYPGEHPTPELTFEEDAWGAFCEFQSECPVWYGIKSQFYHLHLNTLTDTAASTQPVI